MHPEELLISYIAPGAPATRRPFSGELPYLRPEIGFTPKWYHEKLNVDFGERWHTDPAYRKQSVMTMREELDRRFPGKAIGRAADQGELLDLLTGVFGACTVAAMYGIPIRYHIDQWPVSEQRYFSDEAMEQISPADPSDNAFFRDLWEQIRWIAEDQGKVTGFINWQGILNNAQRLRGQQIFIDMLTEPDKTLHLFGCICTTMIESARKVQFLQRESGVNHDFFTVSNCLVNMLSPELYTQFILPFDQRISENFSATGIHNCAWNATPYLNDYALVKNVRYIDMGLESDLKLAGKLFPRGRRAIMYTPMEVAAKPIYEILADMERIARDYGPCDIVAADIEAGTPDSRVADLIEICADISAKYDSRQG
jgi:hypothetical protein